MTDGTDRFGDLVQCVAQGPQVQVPVHAAELLARRIFLRVVATDFLADSAGFAAAIGAWRTQLDLVARDGHIPEEVRRGSAGLSYSQEALLYKLAVARIAARRGIDLWNARAPSAARSSAQSTWSPGPGLVRGVGRGRAA